MTIRRLALAAVLACLASVGASAQAPAPTPAPSPPSRGLLAPLPGERDMAPGAPIREREPLPGETIDRLDRQRQYEDRLRGLDQRLEERNRARELESDRQRQQTQQDLRARELERQARERERARERRDERRYPDEGDRPRARP